MGSLVGYVFYFGYYIDRLVGFAFFRLLCFRIFFNFFLSSVFKCENFREVSNIFSVMSWWLSG